MTHTNILLESGTNELEIIEFQLEERIPGEEDSYTGYYGVNVAKVLEIIRKPESVTELPEAASSCVLGAFNLRSRVIPLVDLSAWLGKELVENDSHKVIVTEFNTVTTAFLVSGVNRIHRISWEEVEPPNEYVSKVSGGSITGVVKIDGRIIFLLDLEHIVGSLNPRVALKLDENQEWFAGEGYKAIVVDDSSVVRNMLTTMLQKAGFAVESYINGREAWERFKEIRVQVEGGTPMQSMVQVVVSDIEMPSMDGHNLCKRIKEDPVLKQLPVILFSSLISDKLRHKGDSVGADDQITKPEVTTLANRSMALIKEYFGTAEI